LRDITKVVYSHHSKPFGICYSSWTGLWWKWILNIPKNKNPLYDMDGKYANLNQPHRNVFFLCQTLESSEKTPYRRVMIPRLAVFMPILNWISVLGEDGNSDEQLSLVAKKRIDAVKNLELSVNEDTFSSWQLMKFRFRSPVLNICLPDNNILGCKSSKTRVVSDGYWIFLKRINYNTRIRSYGSCSSGVTKINVNYDIIVN
jgi:hypothetical protein